ncbi:MAG TPA: alpha/beta hydrolase [Aurantimonas sp.]|nr:alpha/beta hydrolase [Aurantimonas sp.]
MVLARHDESEASRSSGAAGARRFARAHPEWSSAWTDEALPARSYVAVGDQRLAYAATGTGPDVVLLHGTLTSLDDMMLGLGPSLARGHHVVAFDRPGHGGSTRIAHDGSLLTQASLVVEGMRALGLRKPIVVGHSNGGALALTLATHYPDEIGGVVALAPLAFAEPRLELMLFGPRGVPGLGQVAARTGGRLSDGMLLPILWNAMFFPQKMPPAFADAVPFAALNEPEEMIATGEDSLAMAASLLSNAFFYPTCRVPVRVFGGSADIVVNHAMQGRLLARIMPDCRFELVNGIGHMLHHFVPDRVAGAVETLTAGSAGRNDRARNRT